jgi:hypothetical protein
MGRHQRGDKNMSKRVTNREAVPFIRNRKEFHNNGRTFWGRYEDNEYRVYSYRTAIAVYREGEGWVLNSTKYSHTTTRHQNLVRQAIA